MTYTDKDGNQYKYSGEDWQVLQAGKGWVNYSGTAFILVAAEDGSEAIVKPAPQPAEQPPQQTTAERDLFLHYVDVVLTQTLSRNPGNLNPTKLASECIAIAQAMIDELRKRGIL